MTNPVVPTYQATTANQNVPDRHFDVCVPGAGAADGVLLGAQSTDKVGLFGVMPVTSPAAPTGVTDTPTVGTGAEVHVDTTFDGGLGTTAYTIGDIVAALKSYGALPQ